MGKLPDLHSIDAFARQMAELQRLVASVLAENARLQADCAELRAENAEVRAASAQVRADSAELQAKYAQLQEELAAVRGEAAEGSARGPAPPSGRKAPPSWVKANVVVVERHKPRRPRAAVPGWRRQEPDRQVIHAVEQCAGCGSALQRGKVVRRRQVVLLPEVRAEVVEHVVVERRCRQCGMLNRGLLPDLGDSAGSQRRLGWDVGAEVAVLRTKLRLPLVSLQWLLEHVWGLRVSEGALCGLLDDAARAGKQAYDGLLADARASPVVYVDETGWRQDGHNGFVWTVSTPQERYLHFNPRRAGRVLLRLVGDDYPGVLVSDFYAAYNLFDGLHQYCWAHLLRDIYALRIQYPDDAGLATWAESMQALYQRSTVWASQPTSRTSAERDATRRAFEAEMLALCQAQPPQAPQATLCERMARYLPGMFMFVAVPEADATNNAAERSLRPLVVARKISGGSRSERGTKTRMTLQSLIDTWELRNEDPMANMLSLLRNQHAPPTKLAPV